jgi:hypothetical protein
MKNKKIIFLVSGLIVIIGLSAYFIIILNNTIKKQSEDIKSLQIATINNIASIAKERMERIETEPDDDYSSIEAYPVYRDDSYRVFAFYNNINVIDLNFDGVPDAVLRSHINGLDYYGAKEISDRNIYGFYIYKPADMPGMIDYWNVVTKEEPGKKIDEFDRDFMVPDMDIPTCTAGKAIRVVFTNQANTLLVETEMENEADSENYANFKIYKLTKTGHIVSPDYIFSHVATIRSKYASCDLEKFANEDIVIAVKEAGF